MDPTRTFTIDRCLGRGGFGEVYRARMTRSGGMEREVALKVLRRDIDPDGQAVRRLRDEGRLLASISHPTILKVHDLVLLDGRIALVTEFVDGHDLTACMLGDDRMGPRALLTVLSHLVGAIMAAWDTRPRPDAEPLRMVHRDIKPSNIRLSPHAVVKLLDFGIARTDAVERESRTRTGMMVGSPAYMAPERFLEHGVLVESDIFSLGAVLYEGLTGTRFYGTLPIPMQVGLAVAPERFEQHLASQLDALEPSELRTLCAEMLAYAPTDRPPLDRLGARLDALSDRTEGPSLERWCRNRPWPRIEERPGELEGQILVEGMLAPPRAGSLSASLLPDNLPKPAPKTPVVVSPPPSVETLALTRPPTIDRRVVLALMFGALLIAAGSLSAGVGAGSLVYALQPSDLPAPDVDVREPEPEPVLPEPIVAPEPEPEPEPPPEPAPRPSRPAAPSASEPLPAPPVVQGASIQAVGADVVFAISSAGRVRLPAHLPEGRYTLEASFNGGPVRSAGAFTVTRGTPTTLRCSNRMFRCTAP